MSLAARRHDERLVAAAFHRAELARAADEFVRRFNTRAELVALVPAVIRSFKAHRGRIEAETRPVFEPRSRTVRRKPTLTPEDAAKQIAAAEAESRALVAAAGRRHLELLHRDHLEVGARIRARHGVHGKVTPEYRAAVDRAAALDHRQLIVEFDRADVRGDRLTRAAVVDVALQSAHPDVLDRVAAVGPLSAADVAEYVEIHRELHDPQHQLHNTFRFVFTA